MAGDTAKFVVEFQAEIKKFKAALKEVKQDQDALRSHVKQTQTQERQGDRQKERVKRQVRREDTRQRKDERDHVKFMAREELKRHRMSLGLIHKTNAEATRLAKQNAALQKRLGGGKGGGGAGQQQAGGGGFLKGVGVGAATAMAVRGIWDFLVGGVTAGYQKYTEYQTAMGRNTGLGRGRDIRRGVRGAMGSRLGFSMIDTASQVPMMARATGVLGPRELQQGQRATGMEGGEVADIFSMLRRSGFSFEGAGRGRQSEGGKQFQKLISAGMASGLEKGRFPEFAQGVHSLVEQQRQLFTGKLNVDDIAKTLAVFGMSGKPGLQGQAGASLYGKISGAITGGGGDEFSQGLFLRAMGFGKPGANTGFYEAERRRESAGRDPTVVMDVMKEIAQEFGGFGQGGGQEAALTMRSSLGVTLEQAEALQDIYSSSQSMDEKMKQVATVMEQSKPLEQQSLEAMKGIGGFLERIAGKTDKGIEVGSKAADTIEKIEDLQLKALTSLVHGIEVLSGYVKDIRDFFNIGKDKDKAAAELKKETQEPLSADPKKRREQLAKRRDLANQGLTSDNADVYNMALAASAQDASEADRRRVVNEFRRKNKVSKDKPYSIQEQMFLETGEGEALLGMQAPDLDIVNKAAPPEMRHRKRKKTDGGTVDPAKPAAPGAAVPAPGASTSSEALPPTGVPAAKINLFIGTTDSRVQPTQQQQNPGSSPVSITRGVQ